MRTSARAFHPGEKKVMPCGLMCVQAQALEPVGTPRGCDFGLAGGEARQTKRRQGQALGPGRSVSRAGQRG